VQLSREKVNRKMTLEPAKDLIVNRSEKTGSHNREASAATGGRPGYQTNSNQPTSLAAGTRKGSHDEEESQVDARNLTGTQQAETDTVGLTPELVRVTIGIPDSYFEKVWRERNPTPAGQEAKPPDQATLEPVRSQESAKIQKHVAGLLPQAKGVNDLSKLVTVTSFQDIKQADIPLPGIGHNVVVWLAEYWSTLALIGLAAVSLVVLRSMVRAAGAPEGAAVHARVAAEPEPGEQESAEAVAARRLRRFSGSGPTLRDEVSEMVREDPDAAANILRSWIGSVK
jgi:flagellar M-ring protein FliF